MSLAKGRRVFTLFLAILGSCRGYCPVVICPGFGNDSIDYDTPLGQPSEVGLKSVLERRGFNPETISAVPVQRIDWVRVAGGLLDLGFYAGNAKPTGSGYGWYIERLKRTVDEMYEESGGEKVILMAHSAGGWLARAAMADGTWCTNDDGSIVKTSERVQCLVTLGAIHKVPEDESTCVTRGCLKFTDSTYPGAFLEEEGIKYISVGGAAIVGDNRKVQELESEADELYSNRGEGSVSRVAFTSYEAVSGNGNLIGDGVVPFEWTQLDGARNIELEGVLHSINEAGTTIPTERWYGSEGVIDRWLPAVLEETGLAKGKINGGTSNFPPLTALQDWTSKIMASMAETTTTASERRDVLQKMAAITLFPLVSLNAANAMYENAPIAVSEIVQLPSGVTFQDLRQGDGEVVSEGKRVNIQWSLKRSNGYIIDSSANNDGVPFIFVVGSDGKDGKQRAIKGLDEGIRGMKVGGIRRIVMPPSLSFVEGLDDGMPGPIPIGFGPKQRIQRVMKLRADVPDESFLLDVKPTRVQ